MRYRQAGPDEDVEDLKDAVMEDMQDIFSSVDKTGAAGGAALAADWLAVLVGGWVKAGHLQQRGQDGRGRVLLWLHHCSGIAVGLMPGAGRLRDCSPPAWPVPDLPCTMAPLPPHLHTAGEGVCVQASTLGSLEALLEFLRSDAVQVRAWSATVRPRRAHAAWAGAGGRRARPPRTCPRPSSQTDPPTASSPQLAHPV